MRWLQEGVADASTARKDKRLSRDPKWLLNQIAEESHLIGERFWQDIDKSLQKTSYFE
jgi:hypothetical protein